MSEQATIKSQGQLLAAARRLLAADTELRWRWEDGRSGHDRGVGVELALDGRRITFGVEFRLNPTARDVELLAEQEQLRPLLIIAPRISDALARLCRENGLNCADLNGRLWLRTEGVLVEREPKQARYRAATQEPNLFAGKSSRLVRALLSHYAREWTHKDLVERTGLSKGLVTRLTQHLLKEGLVSQRDRALKVTRRDALLDGWVSRDEWRKRTTVQQYSLLVQEPIEIATRLRDFLGDEPHAFTQWIGGWLRHPHTVPPVVTAYVREFPEALKLEKRLLARQVEEGGRLWLVVPNDEGVLRETQTAEGFTLAADVQIYLDLIRAGQRGDEQAAELRKWPDFWGGRSARASLEHFANIPAPACWPPRRLC